MSYKCADCRKSFTTKQGLSSHCTAKRHSPGLRNDYCYQCNRHFANRDSLDKHMHDSPVHKQLVLRNNITLCTVLMKRLRLTEDPACHDTSDTPPSVYTQRYTTCFVCPSKFKTPSALAQHLESGCHRRLPLNRHHITAAVQSLPIASKISLRSSIEGTQRPVLQIARPLISYQALPTSFNGQGYQCHICQKTFRALLSLESHLNSPVHDEDEFKCPKCNTHFKLVSGLVQHLESASCGLSNLEDVEKWFANMTAPLSGLLELTL